MRNNVPAAGMTGHPVLSNGRSAPEMISPPTPISNSKTPHSSVASSPRPDLRKSRPNSIVASPCSDAASAHLNDLRTHRFTSLDERVSSLEAESRQQTDASGKNYESFQTCCFEIKPKILKRCFQPFIKISRSL